MEAQGENKGGKKEYTREGRSFLTLVSFWKTAKYTEFLGLAREMAERESSSNSSTILPIPSG